MKGDVIKTDDVTYGLENTTHAITGWYLEGSYQTPVDSVTLDKENITVYATRSATGNTTERSSTSAAH